MLVKGATCRLLCVHWSVFIVNCHTCNILTVDMDSMACLLCETIIYPITCMERLLEWHQALRQLYLYTHDVSLVAAVEPVRLYEVIRRYDSCNTGELDRHAQHQQPCLASRTLRVIVRQEQPVLSGTHWSSFAHRQMSVVLCLRRFPIKIESCHIRHQRPPKVHQRPPR